MELQPYLILRAYYRNLIFAIEISFTLVSQLAPPDLATFNFFTTNHLQYFIIFFASWLSEAEVSDLEQEIASCNWSYVYVHTVFGVTIIIIYSCVHNVTDFTFAILWITESSRIFIMH